MAQETSRITFSIPNNISALVAERARAERRSISSYISVLIERDLDSVGMLPPIMNVDIAERRAKVIAALDAAPSLLADVEALLTERTRSEKKYVTIPA